MNLLDHRLLIVSGKGGVGKTTISLALGLIAAKQGKKVLIAEVNSEEQVAHLLRHPPIGYQETELLPTLWPSLWGINIDPKKAFEEYVLLQIKFRGLYRAVFENRFVRRLIDATPGLADLMLIGKIYDLIDHYDLVIVDSPATGHGMALLEIPSIVSRAVRVGPLQTEAEKIDLLLHDPAKTKIVLVTLPEEMPVAETVEMKRNLENRLKLSLGPVLLNQIQTHPFQKEELREIKKFRRDRESEDPISLILEFQIGRAELSREYASRLSEEINDLPILSVPFIYSSQFGLTEIQMIAGEIEKQ